VLLSVTSAKPCALRSPRAGSNCHRLARALLKQSGSKASFKLALQEAEGLSRRAVEIFTRLRSPENLKEAQKTLAEIEERMKDESGRQV
jgi:hypothetical protein